MGCTLIVYGLHHRLIIVVYGLHLRLMIVYGLYLRLLIVYGLHLRLIKVCGLYLRLLIVYGLHLRLIIVYGLHTAQLLYRITLSIHSSHVWDIIGVKINESYSGNSWTFIILAIDIVIELDLNNIYRIVKYQNFFLFMKWVFKYVEIWFYNVRHIVFILIYKANMEYRRFDVYIFFS